MGRRVLVTGLATSWGAQVAKALEADSDVELVVGVDREAPRMTLERTEHVPSDGSYAALARIVADTQVDTIVHPSLVLDSTRVSGPALHELNVIGTTNLLAAATAGTSVRQVVVRSSTLVYGSALRDPVWWGEDMVRTSPASNEVERSLVEVEACLADFAEENPGMQVSLLRLAEVVGPAVDSPVTRCLRRGIVPCIAGFDPLVQLVAQEDALGAIELVVRRQLPGTYNVAGDGRLPWSEVAAICGARLAPLPPVLTTVVAAPLTQAGLLDVPPELLSLLRYGTGADNQALKQAGFAYRFTSAGAARNFAQASQSASQSARPASHSSEVTA